MYAAILQAVVDARVARARKGQWIDDWNIDGYRVDRQIGRLEDAGLIEAPARGVPTIEPEGVAVLARLHDARDLDYLAWRP